MKSQKPAKSGFEPIPKGSEPCCHPGHNPPGMLVIPQGQQYRHVCPGCGAVAILRPTQVRCNSAGHDPLQGLSGDSIKGHFDELKAMGGASHSMAFKDAQGKALAAVIFVRGKPESDEILKAVAKVEEDWQ